MLWHPRQLLPFMINNKTSHAQLETMKANHAGRRSAKPTTKVQLIALHTQVNSIETELRSMKHTKLHGSVADFEDKAFGAARD
jgi:hypothetical protein